MKNLIFGISILFIVAAIIIVYFNRDNSTIYNRFIGVLFLGSIGLLISVLFNIEEEKYEERFVTSIILNKKTNVTERPSNVQVSELFGQDTYYFNSFFLNYNEDGTPKKTKTKFTPYNLIEKRIIDLYRTRFSHSWLLDPHTYYSSRGKSTSATINETKQKIIAKESLSKIFNKNPLFKIDDSKYLVDTNVNLPLKSELIKKGNCVVIKNKYVTLNICYQGLSGGSFTGPSKKLTFNNQLTEKELEIIDVKMNTSINSNKYISGNNEFKKHMEWAKTFIEVVKEDFDGNEVWKELSK